MVFEYIIGVSKLIDNHALAGDKTIESDKVLYTLSSLGDDYKVFVQKYQNSRRQCELRATPKDAR